MIYTFAQLPSGLTFDSPIEDHAQYLATSIHLQPYPGKTVELGAIPREFHGVLHHDEAAALVTVFVNFARFRGVPEAFEVTPRVLKLLTLTVLLHDTGREDDAHDHWDKDSAVNCFHYFKQLGISSEEAISYAHAIANKDMHYKMLPLPCDYLRVHAPVAAIDFATLNLPTGRGYVDTLEGFVFVDQVNKQYARLALTQTQLDKYHKRCRNAYAAQHMYEHFEQDTGLLVQRGFHVHELHEAEDGAITWETKLIPVISPQPAEDAFKDLSSEPAVCPYDLACGAPYEKPFFCKIVHDADCFHIMRIHGGDFDGTYLHAYKDLPHTPNAYYAILGELIGEMRSVLAIQGDSPANRDPKLKKTYEFSPAAFQKITADFATRPILAALFAQHQLLSQEQINTLNLKPAKRFTDQHLVFARALAEPSTETAGKTYADTEFDFILPSTSMPSSSSSTEPLTPETTDLGNIDRSFTLLGRGAQTYASAGYLLIDPPTAWVQHVSHTNSSSGRGAKYKRLGHHPGNPQSDMERVRQLYKLRHDMIMGVKPSVVEDSTVSYIARAGNQYAAICGFNECSIDAKPDNTYLAFFYNEDPCVYDDGRLSSPKRKLHPFSPRLQAIYPQKRYQQKTGVSLKLYAYSYVHYTFEEKTWTDEDILGFWQTMCVDGMQQLVFSEGCNALDRLSLDAIKVYVMYGGLNNRHQPQLRLNPADMLSADLQLALNAFIAQEKQKLIDTYREQVAQKFRQDDTFMFTMECYEAIEQRLLVLSAEDIETVRLTIKAKMSRYAIQPILQAIAEAQMQLEDYQAEVAYLRRNPETLADEQLELKTQISNQVTQLICQMVTEFVAFVSFVNRFEWHDIKNEIKAILDTLLDISIQMGVFTNRLADTLIVSVALYELLSLDVGELFEKIVSITLAFLEHNRKNNYGITANLLEDTPTMLTDVMLMIAESKEEIQRSKLLPKFFTYLSSLLTVIDNAYKKLTLINQHDSRLNEAHDAVARQVISILEQENKRVAVVLNKPSVFEFMPMPVTKVENSIMLLSECIELQQKYFQTHEALSEKIEQCFAIVLNQLDGSIEQDAFNVFVTKVAKYIALTEQQMMRLIQLASCNPKQTSLAFMPINNGPTSLTRIVVIKATLLPESDFKLAQQIAIYTAFDQPDITFSYVKNIQTLIRTIAIIKEYQLGHLIPKRHVDDFLTLLNQSSVTARGDIRVVYENAIAELQCWRELPIPAIAMSSSSSSAPVAALLYRDLLNPAVTENSVAQPTNQASDLSM